MLTLIIALLLLFGAIEQPAKGATLSCGQYNKALDMCCDGILVRKKGPAGRCCANAGYDPRFQVCCKGKVWWAGGMQQAQCCGQHPYDAALKRCCPGEVVKSSC